MHHILYHGTRGPGKTDTQLHRFLRLVGRGYGQFWRGIIFDREYKNLDDLVSKSKRWFHAYEDGARFLESKSDYRWIWPGGEELLFRQIKTQDDYWSYHGQEFPFIGWNELCKYSTSDLYDKMMSCNRSSFIPELHTPDRDVIGYNENGESVLICNRQKGLLLPSIPLEVFSTTNPAGPGHNWVKRRFIAPAPNGQVVRRKTRVYNPRTKIEEETTKMQVAIFGHWRENIYLSPEYIMELLNQPDSALQAAWSAGSWDIVAGGALDDAFDRNTHVLPRFQIPDGWIIDRALDWGSSHPCSVGWFAEANGEEAELPDGSVFCPPPGSLIQIDEIYFTKEIGSNVGLKLPATDVAKAIKERERLLVDNYWINDIPIAGPADNQIRDVRESDVDTIEKKMSDIGVSWEHSDKSPGSRKIGLSLMREMLINAKRREGPGLYFMQNCIASIETIPVIPRHDTKVDDVDTDAEDHCYDMVRYRVLKGANRMATNLNIMLPT